MDWNYKEEARKIDPKSERVIVQYDMSLLGVVNKYCACMDGLGDGGGAGRKEERV